MSLQIRTPEADALARELAEATGEDIETAVIGAIEERLARQPREPPTRRGCDSCAVRSPATKPGARPAYPRRDHRNARCLTGAGGTLNKLLVSALPILPGTLRRRLLLGGAMLFLIGAAPPSEDAQGLKIPRFVSMRLGEVNLRVGPGQRYPIAWVFTKKDMPVEIVEEFDTWRKIRDWEGTEGWVNHAALSGKRSVMVTGEIRALRGSPDAQASPVARVEPGVIGKLLECPAESPGWCRIEAEDVRGWIKRGEFWGVYPQETYPQ